MAVPKKKVSLSRRRSRWSFHKSRKLQSINYNLSNICSYCFTNTGILKFKTINGTCSFKFCCVK